MVEFIICDKCRLKKNINHYCESVKIISHHICKECYIADREIDLLKREKQKLLLEFRLDRDILNKKNLKSTKEFNRVRSILIPKIFKRDSNRCVLCKTDENLIIHDILPTIMNPNLVNNENNMIVLCDKCKLLTQDKKKNKNFALESRLMEILLINKKQNPQ